MNQQQNKNVQPPGPVVDWPMIACFSVGLPLELMLHDITTFGARAVGPRAGMAVLLMALFVAFHPADNCVPLSCFLLAVIPLSIVAHIRATAGWRRGKQPNTRYNGRPYLMRLLPWNEMTIKRLESCTVLCAGWGIHHLNQPLGAFLMTAAVGMAVRVGIEHRTMCRQIMDMNDAMSQQKRALESLRNLQRR